MNVDYELVDKKFSLGKFRDIRKNFSPPPLFVYRLEGRDRLEIRASGPRPFVRRGVY